MPAEPNLDVDAISALIERIKPILAGHPHQGAALAAIFWRSGLRVTAATLRRRLAPASTH